MSMTWRVDTEGMPTSFGGCAADDVGMLEMGVDDVDTLLAQ